MGGRLPLVVIAGLLIYITGNLSNHIQEDDPTHLAVNNVRNVRSALKEAIVENKKKDGKSSKKGKGNKNGRRRNNKKKNIRRKKKIDKIKNAKKSGSKNRIRKGKNEKNEKTKIMQRRRKQKKKDKQNNKVQSRQTQTCSGITEVDTTCLENARFVLVFEANQVTNYLKQSKILIRHDKQTSNKQGKKGEFEEAARHMLWAVGGNISDPKCGSNDTSLLTRAKETRDLQSTLSNYEKLLNCSAKIQEACTTPSKSYNVTIAAKIKTCNDTMEEFKDEVAKCIDLKDAKNSITQCACWNKAKVAMDEIKKLKCQTKADQLDVTNSKKACVKVFIKCKKMEDASVELIYKCMDDHSMRLINQTAESLHSGAMKDTAKTLAEAEEKAKQVISGELDAAKQLELLGKIRRFGN